MTPYLSSTAIRECQAIAALEPTSFTDGQLRLLDAIGGCTYNLIRKAPVP